MKLIVRPWVWWPLAVFVVAGIVVLFWLPQPWKQVAVTVVFAVELILVVAIGKRNTDAADLRLQVADAMLRHSNGVAELYADQYAKAVTELRKHDPRAAEESQRAVLAGLNQALAVGIAAHRRDRDDG